MMATLHDVFVAAVLVTAKAQPFLRVEGGYGQCCG